MKTRHESKRAADLACAGCRARIRQMEGSAAPYLGLALLRVDLAHRLELDAHGRRRARRVRARGAVRSRAPRVGHHRAALEQALRALAQVVRVSPGLRHDASCEYSSSDCCARARSRGMLSQLTTVPRARAVPLWRARGTVVWVGARARMPKGSTGVTSHCEGCTAPRRGSGGQGVARGTFVRDTRTRASRADIGSNLRDAAVTGNVCVRSGSF